MHKFQLVVFKGIRFLYFFYCVILFYRSAFILFYFIELLLFYFKYLYRCWILLYMSVVRGNPKRNKSTEHESTDIQ